MAIFFSPIGPKNTNLVEEVDLTSSKMSQPIRDRDGHLVFLIDPKNRNLVEDVEILLPAKFC